MYDNFERSVLGIWEKENSMITKKEGMKMIESLNLIDIYKIKKIEKIETEYKEKINKIRNNISLEDNLKDIIVKAEEQIKELYFSQFTKEQMEAYSKGNVIDQSGFSLISREEIKLTSNGSIYVNTMLENDEIHELYKEMHIKIDELSEKIKVVKAHVGIAKTKEEVEDILIKYDILNKKGKLVFD